MIAKPEVAVFGGGCFWCVEAVFAELNGVVSVMPGYAGGHTENPTYRQVCSGSTGHAEVAKVEFDANQVSYHELLEVFFATHDPTTLNRQGADHGTQYRSVVLYTTDAQRDEVEAFLRSLEQSAYQPGKVVTEVVKLEKFYEAEPEHVNFYAENSASMYCQIVIRPKVDKVREHFPAQLRRPEKV
jgi:peptide-methionine (S)-S-oxide reductase